MAKSKKEVQNIKIPEMVTEALQQISKLLGVAVTELWTIFVRQYVVRGLNELFTAVVLFTGAYFLKDYIHFWALIPVALGIGLVYGAISYLGNPKYYALEDITDRIRDFSQKESKKQASSGTDWRIM